MSPPVHNYSRSTQGVSLTYIIIAIYPASLSPHVDIKWKFMLKQPHIYTFLHENSVKLELSPPVHNINIWYSLCDKTYFL